MDDGEDDNEQLDKQIQRRYEIIHKMGKGAYGVVFRAKDRESERIVALKKVFGAFQNATDSQRTYREITILRQLRGHPFIVGLLAVHRAENDSDLYLVFELMETDVHAVIRAGILMDIHHRYIFWQLCCSLKYMHSAGLIHRDLKPGNILIQSNSLIKVCDFGLSRFSDYDGPPEPLTDYIATRWYRSPEILFGSTAYGTAIDMWACGCILAELIGGRPLFPGASTMDQLERIMSFSGPPSPSDLESMKSQYAEMMMNNVGYTRPRMTLEEKLPNAAPEAIDLIDKLLKFDPSQRPTATECLSHPYLVQFHHPKREIDAPGKIVMALPDSQRFTAREYRNQIYRESVTAPEVRRKKG